MNFNSIITKLLFVFFIVVVLFGLISRGYYLFEVTQQHKRVNNSYKKVAQNVKENRMNSEDIIKYLESLNFKEIQDPATIMDKKSVMLAGPGYESINQKGQFYINLHTPFHMFLFQDLNFHEKNYYGFWIIGIMFLIVSSVFIWIIKTLQPLKKLKDEIKDFANGNLDIECKSDKKDEIAEVANEFDGAVKKISLLLESRQLFLRTVMHELKTPIAKGKIVSSLIEDEIQKNRISIIFDKLNQQINDFAKTEQVISQNYKVNMSFFSIGAILNSAVDMMMLDNADEKIIVENISQKKLKVDLGLFALAIKNLLDNGLKYSTDGIVHVQEETDALCISTVGDKLSRPLEEYFKPFHNDTKAKNHGMGLGLYIVHSIAKMHSMNLEYKYSNGLNIFKIKYTN